jgi:hypothetical protein
MTQYLLSVHTGPADLAAAGEAPSMDPGGAVRLHKMEEEMKASGTWLFSGRLTGPEVATVVRASANGEVLTTDGPFVESKEHLAGFYLIEADDLDAALGWARRTSEIIGMPIEVRPFWATEA